MDKECITHNAPLTLCEQCVLENGMRMKRRLLKEFRLALERNYWTSQGPSHYRESLLKAFEERLDQELPG